MSVIFGLLNSWYFDLILSIGIALLGSIITLVVLHLKNRYRKIKSTLEHQFQTFFRDVQDPMIIMDGYSLLDCNAKAVALFQASCKEDILGCSLFTFSPRIQPDGQSSEEKAIQIINQVLEGEPQQYEWEHTALNGNHFFVEVQLHRLHFQGKQYIQAVLREITNRKRIEAQLYESERRYRILFENAPIGVFQSTLDGKITASNPSFARMLGFNTPQKLIESITDIATDLYENPEQRMHFIQELKIKRKQVHFNVRFRKRNNQTIFLNLYMTPVFDEQGTLQYIDGIAEDITERERAAQAIWESENRFRTAIELLPIIYAEFSLERRLLYLNHTGFHLTGYTPNDLHNGIYTNDLLKEITPEHVQGEDSLANLFDGMMIHLLRCKNGTLIPVQIHSVPLMNEDQVVGLRSVILDLSEQARMAREKKEQNRKLIQSDKLLALRELAAGIAHEINQPLSVIALGLSNIKRMVISDNQLEDRVNIKINKLQQSIERIKSLIEHIRIFSRDQADVSQQYFDCHEAIANALSMTENRYNRAGIVVQKDLQADQPILLGNMYKFEQVILNLLTNARDALEEKKKHEDITFQPTITLHSTRQDDRLLICVADNGIGIPPSIREKLFQPFFTTKPVDKGTGLGLSVSYGIIKEMAGDITIESTETIQTTITLTFYAPSKTPVSPS